MVNQLRSRWGLVIAEGIAVSLGVLLAFAIQAWWEEIQRGEEEQLLMQVVVSELDQVESQLEISLRFVREHKQDLAKGLNNLSKPSEMDAQALAAELVPLGSLTIRPIPRTAVDDLVGSGSFRLIENQEVRKSINVYRQDLEYTAEVYSIVRELEHAFFEYTSSHGNLYAMTTSFAWQQDGVELDVVDIPPDFSKFIANREFANRLWTRVSWVGIYEVVLLKQAGRASDLRAKIISAYQAE